jgi:hypothetical protein
LKRQHKYCFILTGVTPADQALADLTLSQALELVSSTVRERLPPNGKYVSGFGDSIRVEIEVNTPFDLMAIETVEMEWLSEEWMDTLHDAVKKGLADAVREAVVGQFPAVFNGVTMREVEFTP